MSWCISYWGWGAQHRILVSSKIPEINQIIQNIQCFNQWWGNVYFKKMDRYLLMTWLYIIFCQLLRTSSEYLTRNGQGSVFKIRKTDPCLYFFEYSPDVLKKKTKVFDVFNTDKKCFMKINRESSPPEIWIIIVSPSLVLTIWAVKR